MTSKKFSDDYKIGLHSFRQALLASLPFTVITTILALFIVRASISPVLSDPRDYSKSFRYIFYQEGIAQVYMQAFLILSAVGSALTVFRYLFKKSAVNVYFSLGISRRRQFLTRFLAGVVMLLPQSVIPMTIDLMINIRIFGFSQVVFAVFFYYIAGYFTLSFLCFTAAALCCAVAGTLPEGVVYSGLLLGGPSLCYYALNELMQKYLLGNAFGVYSNDGPLVADSILKYTIHFNPLLFFYRDAEKYSICAVNLTSGGSDAPPLFPIHPLPVVLWALIGVVLMLLALRLYETRRGEYSGVSGHSKIISSLCMFFLVFFTFASVQTLPGAKTASILIGTLAAAAVFLLCEFLLRLSFIKALKSSVRLPFHLAVCFLALLIVATGGLGYSTRVPAAENVYSAFISYKGSSDLIGNFSCYGSDGTGFTDFAVPKSELLFKTDSDIKTVIALHKAIIGSKSGPLNKSNIIADPSKTFVKSGIEVFYRLKDGKTVSRWYDRTTIAILEQMLTLDNTDAVKALTRKSVNVNAKDSDNYYPSGDIVLSDGLYSNYTKLPTNDGFRQGLLNAITSDYSRQTVRGRYFPATPAQKILLFQNDDQNDSPQIKKVFLTAEFTNTLAYLQSKGYGQSSGSSAPVLSVEIARCPMFDNFSPESTVNYFFRSFHGEEGSVEAKFYPVSGQNRAEDLIALSRTNYFAGNGGYLLRIKLKKTVNYTYRFLPQNDAPDFVRTIVK